MKIFSWSFAFTVVFFPSLAFGFDEFEFKDRSSFVELSGADTTKNDLLSGAGQYHDSTARLNADIPLYQSDFTFSLRPDVSSTGMEQPYGFQYYNLYDLRLGLEGSYHSSGNELYLLQVTYDEAEASNSIGSPKPFFTAYALGTYHFNQKIFLYYGLDYSYVWINRYLLPLIGVNWQILPKLRLIVLLPVVAGISYKPLDDLKIWGYLSVYGQKFHLANAGAFPNQGSDIYLRTGGLKLGTTVTYSFNRQWAVLGDLGFLFGRPLNFSDDNSTFISDTIKPGSYGQIGIKWYFGSAESSSGLDF